MPLRDQTNILVADDDPATLLALESILDDPSQRLVKARSGEEALRHLLNDDFAVVVLDVGMNGLSGYETARYIRERKRTEHTPIIFLTGASVDEGDLFAGYSVGAIDYLMKPVLPHVLKSKVRAFVDLFNKTEEVKRQATLLQESQLREHQRELNEARARWEAERLRDELRLAGDIQRRLFPASPTNCHGLDLFGQSLPAESTGGDYFDYLVTDDCELGIAIGDVSGHGIGSALTMASTRAYVRALALGETNPGRILKLANRALADDVADGSYVTMLLGQFHPARRSFIFAGAGHPPGYVLAPSGETRMELISEAMPLGVLDDGDFPMSEVGLEPGELIVLLTDGILEAMSPDDRLFGVQRALDVVRGNRDQPARDIVGRLFDAVCRFTHPAAPLDDMTAIVVKTSSSF